MKVLRSAVVALAESLGYKAAGKWNAARMEEKMKILVELDPEGEEAQALDDPDQIALLKKIVGCEGVVEVVSKESDLDEEVEEAVEESEEDDSEDEQEDEDVDEEDDEPEDDTNTVEEVGSEAVEEEEEEIVEKSSQELGEEVKNVTSKKTKGSKTLKSKKERVAKPKKEKAPKLQKEKKPKKGRVAKPKKESKYGAKFPGGIHSVENRLYKAAVVIKRHGLEAGCSDSMVEELDAMMEGKSNMVASKSQLTFAWHAVNGFING